MLNDRIQHLWPADSKKNIGLGDEVYFSPDSKRIAYIVSGQGGQFVVLDGVAQTAYAEISEGFYGFPGCDSYPDYGKASWDSRRVVFSPDSHHFAYVARTTNSTTRTIVLDGEPKQNHPAILAGGVFFSPNSNRMAYGAEDESRRQCLVLDGQAQQPFYGTPSRPSFSPDSQHVAYIASDRSPNHLLVIDSEVFKMRGRRIIGSRPIWDSSLELHTIITHGQEAIISRFRLA